MIRNLIFLTWLLWTLLRKEAREAYKRELG